MVEYSAEDLVGSLVSCSAEPWAVWWAEQLVLCSVVNWVNHLEHWWVHYLAVLLGVLAVHLVDR